MCSRGFKKLFLFNPGLTAYADTWALQKKMVSMRARGLIPDCLIITEHHPVITLGRGTDRKNLLVSAASLKKKKIDLVEIERGGDITFHGPGQLVAYPIIDLTGRGRDTHKYLRDLENVIIATLADFDLEAGLKNGLTGVWVNDRKLAAIGVAVSRWITYHGLALNVTTDLNYFKLINPCGITEYPVGSVAGLLNRTLPVDAVAEALVENFAAQFYYEPEKTDDIYRIINTSDHTTEIYI